MKPPFPYFGGKRRIAPLVWERLGCVKNYVEPFAGGLAVLLARPLPESVKPIETVNDINGWITNFWRAIKTDAELVARTCDYPVSELDMHARYVWLARKYDNLVELLRADPEFFDAELAGWWVWGQSIWIGHDWADATRLTMGSAKRPSSHERGVAIRQIPSGHGEGITGLGRPHLGRGNIVTVSHAERLISEFQELSERLRFTRICCGDWSRVCTSSSLDFHGLSGVFLDPPYAVDDRKDCYIHDDRQVSQSVGEWCRKNESNPKLRIALAGYEGEHDLPRWDCVAWSADGGHGNRAGNQNRHRERIWFSPNCLQVAAGPQQLTLEM